MATWKKEKAAPGWRGQRIGTKGLPNSLFFEYEQEFAAGSKVPGGQLLQVSHMFTCRYSNVKAPPQRGLFVLFRFYRYSCRRQPW
jgi:hypothetical protein